MRKINALPIGYSDVERVIKTGYYVDKTKYAQELIEKGNPIFIARPRRFSKSLFINTLDTICSGEQETKSIDSWAYEIVNREELSKEMNK